ncbi:putative phosphatidylinositol-4-phosphate 5-kinase type II beta [Trypanosoma cruzi]|uniref:Phosphatidylinositol-4-phosphate 5-Kinase, putative n=2 Tax=Trypanosoma cruzi TaxID=5693 RepID=Q4DGE5_TRYCC|nr:phosphatidylinositol-4-phosphate 5-Kinase, putative [Trypanosoma cruzi]EAN91601.1 phosphatidylinositol-4-phosphate 5-Kinase, putative [Trypanosoma cruzi]PWV04001.1 putative phosphatidylinositol-4-phosphate 5-kinase type II beta [Trypanosoma cruzi]RNC47017.1 putative phosphatidylinositol-4-phosphate 5-kinase [Trypanosoma cruzi]|eukprot:XP_813452.1 phosphatidylinositol-4-phosphate 5-Kinase [Trypanosoma cruzi strain CL Brener]
MTRDGMLLPLLFGKWEEFFELSSSVYDVASGARSREACLYYDEEARPMSGHAVLLSSHVILTESLGGKVLFWVEFASVRGMRCTERLLLPGKSFGCPTSENEPPNFEDESPGTATVAQKIVSLDIFVEGAAVSLRMKGSEGEQFARAALILWRMNHGEMEAVTAPLYYPGDAVYALAGAPVRLSATVVQCVTVEKSCPFASGEAVDIVMLNEREICIARRPRTAVTLWRDLNLSGSEEMELLPVDSLSALVAPWGNTVRLVGRRGDVWLLETSDPATDVTVRYALQRLTELFLLGMLRSQRFCAVTAEPCRGLRYFDLTALYHQYCAMDAEGAGYILCSSLEAAMGPLLACDSRLVQAMRCDDVGDAGADASGKVSLPMYLNHMRVMLQGSVSERAEIAFRSFGGGMCRDATMDPTERNGEGEGKTQERGLVRLTDFKLIARDILFGLSYKSSIDDESVKDTVDNIVEAVYGNCNKIVETMSFPDFLQAYTLLMELPGQDKMKGCNMPHVCGTPHPLLGFGSAHWVLLTYVMTGVELSVRAAAEASECGEKNTFELTKGTPTIAGVSFVSNSSPTGGAPSFFRKHISSFQSDRVAFTDYRPLLFASVRMRLGIHVDTFLDALGISALRARLLLGHFCAPRFLRSSGRSGALLLRSHDDRFILKRVTITESRTLRSLLPVYVDHLDRYPHSLLPRYAGLYALWRGSEKNSFVVTENVFAFAQFSITEVYDLKGSTTHRTTTAEDRRHGAAGKDNDFLASKKRLRVSSEARKALLAQLEVDTQLLERANRLDYSLLVGIHSGKGDWASSKEAVELSLRQRRRMADLVATIDAQPERVSTDEFKENKKSDNVFHAYYGGVSSFDGSEVYYLGIVDCLTTYGLKKVGEHYGKSVLLQDMKEISCVPPPDYRSRFMNFMRSIIDD